MHMIEPRKPPKDPAGETGDRTTGRRGSGRDAHHVNRGDTPNAHFDERLPEDSAREHPDGSPPRPGRKGDKDTDEAS
jgi:hypothetical protein